MTLSPDQGRAPHLYDEQLQRVQQEKMLAEAAAAGSRPFLLGSSPPSPVTAEAKAGPT